MNRHVALPPTEAGAKLALPQELAEQCKVVYEKAAEGAYRFRCAYDPEVDYSGDCIVVPLTSVYEGTEDWAAGRPFANVLGSTGDSGEYHGATMTWHAMADALGIPWACHEEQNNFYDCFSGNLLQGPEYYCGPNICGGHVIQGTRPAYLQTGSRVYIVPICSRHNSKNVPHGNPNTTPGNGNGFCMRMASDAKVIRLTGYLQLP